MHCFITKQPVTLHTQYGVRSYLSSESLQQADSARIYIATPGEERLVREQLCKAQPSTKKEANCETAQSSESDVCRIAENAFSKWVHFPARLGRTSKGAGMVLPDAQLLAVQLQNLRQRKPAQHHFRFAVVNGFGTNLGDTLIGMSAMRHVAKLFALHVPSFSVDMLYGVDSSTGNVHISRAEWIEQQLHHGPALIDFTRYDGWFDFTNILNEPEFGARPIVDWYLWWMGISPESIPNADKRNSLELTLPDWEVAVQLLRKYQREGMHIVWFSPDASVKLRTIPQKEARRLARGILDCAPNCILICDQDIINHKRMIKIQKQSFGVYMSLLAQVDGIITVDSFPIHVADAVSTPCVTIYASTTPSWYPYYPHSADVTLTNFEKLPAYGRCKVSDDEWNGMEKDYVQAWQDLNAAEVWQTLWSKIVEQSDRKVRSKQCGLNICANATLKQSVALKTRVVSEVSSGIEHLLPYERSSELWEKTQVKLAYVGKGVLPHGGTCVLAGAGQSNLPFALASHLGRNGVLHVVDPRRERLQLVTGDLTRAGLFAIRPHECMPVVSDNPAVIAATDPLSETHPDRWGNLLRKETVATQSLDSLNLSTCHALLVQRPLPVSETIKGFKTTLELFRPNIVAAPVTRIEALEACKAIGKGYKFWVGTVHYDLNGTEQFLFLGVPEEKDTRLEGFRPIQINNNEDSNDA